MWYRIFLMFLLVIIIGALAFVFGVFGDMAAGNDPSLRPIPASSAPSSDDAMKNMKIP